MTHAIGTTAGLGASVLMLGSALWPFATGTPFSGRVQYDHSYDPPTIMAESMIPPAPMMSEANANPWDVPPEPMVSEADLAPPLSQPLPIEAPIVPADPPAWVQVCDGGSCRLVRADDSGPISQPIMTQAIPMMQSSVCAPCAAASSPAPSYASYASFQPMQSSFGMRSCGSDVTGYQPMTATYRQVRSYGGSCGSDGGPVATRMVGSQPVVMRRGLFGFWRPAR